MLTQWRVVSIGRAGIHYQGLDYSAVKARLGEVSPDLWAGIQTMELAARAALNER